MVELLAAVGVFLLAIHLKTGTYIIEQRFLLGVVGCAEMCGAFKHQMLEIMGKSRCLGRVVAASGANCNICLNTRFLLVDGHIYLHAVVEGINSRLHKIALNCLIPVVLCLCRQKESNGTKG